MCTASAGCAVITDLGLVYLQVNRLYASYAARARSITAELIFITVVILKTANCLREHLLYCKVCIITKIDDRALR